MAENFGGLFSFVVADQVGFPVAFGVRLAC
jgi:hypothetical protein